MKKILPFLVVFAAASTVLAAPKPKITSATTGSGTVGVPYSYQITADQAINTWGAAPLPAGLTVNTSTGLISGTPTTAGTYSITLSATNGNGTGTATLTLTISNPSPTPTPTATFTPTPTPTATFTPTPTATFTPTPTPTATYTPTPTATATFTPTPTATFTPTPTPTPSATFTPTPTPTPTPCSSPNMGNNNDATGTVGVAFSYQIRPTNADSYNATGLPPGLTVNTTTGLISGTPTTAGIYTVTLFATKNGCTGSKVVTFTISAASPTPTPTPTFTPTPTPTATATFTPTPTPTGTPSPSPSPTPTPTGTPCVVITNPPAPPNNTATGQVGSGFSYTITATPANRYCASGLPPSNSLRLSGNVISGTPVAGDVGTWNVTISAFTGGNCNNPPACYAQATLVLTICPDAPSITSALTATAILGTPFSYQITADNSPTSFDATDLPGGLTVCHDTTEGCTPGLISGTPTALGVFPVTISATSATTGPCGSGTATDTLTLTITMPGGIFIPPFPGQINVFGWGPSAPPPGAQITFPNATTGNYFILYWNAPGSNTNQAIADSANGGLKRNNDPTFNSSPLAMQFNPYDPTLPRGAPSATPIPDLNVWRGNPIPPIDNTTGQFGDPRASWYITDPWPTDNYLTKSYWAGPNPTMVPLNWPDSGHPFSYTGNRPTGPGQYPTDIMGGPSPPPTPPPDRLKGISRLSDSNTGNLASVTELGNVWDPAQLSYTVANQGGALPDIPTSALKDARGAGAHTLAIGRPEFSVFDQPSANCPTCGNGTRAWQLLDVVSGKISSTNFTNTAGLVNVNTASRDVLRSLAAGILQNSDPAIQPGSLQNNLYPPTVTKAADQFADAIINSRPLLSTSALSAIRVTPPGGSQPEPFFGNPHQYNNQTPPSEWNDPGREELFAKIYNLATTRSRNFRVFVTGQSLDKKGNVLSTVTKVYHVFIKPTRDPTTGAIQQDPVTHVPLQQVQIKYEGSM